MNNVSFYDITVGIPTYKRIDKLLQTIEKILYCNPQPNEIIVHVDNNDRDSERIIKEKYPKIKTIMSENRIGPGGGRNKIISRAKNQIVASFDDDSYPLDPDYFTRVITLFEKFPNAAVISAAIFHIGEIIQLDKYTAYSQNNFVGCGCAYRRDVFNQTSGYVALPLAYGMEEVDLSLRLINMQWEIINSPWLRVFHNTRLEHHTKPQITAASIANQILLTYLRYPMKFWVLGFLQCINRIFWLIKHGRLTGILLGIISVPRLILRYQSERQPVTNKSLNKYLNNRDRSTAIDLT